MGQALIDPVRFTFLEESGQPFAPLGAGTHPGDALRGLLADRYAKVRAFVDALGRLNHDMAAGCARVTLMCAGLPLTLNDESA